jgi:hypothetical protein
MCRNARIFSEACAGNDEGCSCRYLVPSSGVEKHFCLDKASSNEVIAGVRRG